MNLKITVLALAMFISAPLAAAERPPQPMETVSTGQSSLDALPADVKRLLVPLIASSKVAEVANTIRSLNATNKFFHNYISNPANMIAILERMPYTANAVDLIGNYLRKTNIPVAKSQQIEKWTKGARARLVEGPTLFDAVEDKDLPKMFALLKNKNLDLNFSTPGNYCNGGTPLIEAAERKNIEAVRALLAAGADPNKPSVLGFTPLMVASRRNDRKEIVTMLLDAGALINAQHTSEALKGETALSLAAILGQKEIVEILLAYGADPDIRSHIGQTARDNAIAYKRPDLVKLFDEAKAKRKKASEEEELLPRRENE